MTRMNKHRAGDRVLVEARILTPATSGHTGSVTVRVDAATDPDHTLDGVELELPAVMVHTDPTDHDAIEAHLSQVIADGWLFDGDYSQVA